METMSVAVRVVASNDLATENHPFLNDHLQTHVDERHRKIACLNSRYWKKNWSSIIMQT